MPFWRIILIFLIIAAALTASAYIVSVYLKKRKIAELKSAKLSPKRRIHSEVGIELYPKNVFSGFSYPCAYSKNGVPLEYFGIDTVAVTRGGIALITVKEYGGLIDSGKGDVWVCRHGNGHTEFANPVIETEEKRKQLLSLMHRNKLPDVPVYGIVVFTGKELSFLTEYDNVTDSKQLMEMLRQLNSEKVLNIAEMFALRQMLNDEKRTRKQVKEHLNKIYG